MREVLEQKIVKTRKDHKCWGCGELFLKGSKLEVLVAVEDSGIVRTYWCPTCREYWCRFMDNDDGINMGDLKSNDPEEWNKIHKQESDTALLLEAGAASVKIGGGK